MGEGMHEEGAYKYWCAKDMCASTLSLGSWHAGANGNMSKAASSNSQNSLFYADIHPSEVTQTKKKKTRSKRDAQNEQDNAKQPYMSDGVAAMHCRSNTHKHNA